MPETQSTESQSNERPSFGPPKDDACTLGPKRIGILHLANQLGEQEQPELEAERRSIIQALDQIEVPDSPEFRSTEIRRELVTLRERLRGLEPKSEGEEKRIITGEELSSAVEKKMAEL